MSKFPGFRIHSSALDIALERRPCEGRVGALDTPGTRFFQIQSPPAGRSDLSVCEYAVGAWAPRGTPRTPATRTCRHFLARVSRIKNAN